MMIKWISILCVFLLLVPGNVLASDVSDALTPVDATSSPEKVSNPSTTANVNLSNVTERVNITIAPLTTTSSTTTTSTAAPLKNAVEEEKGSSLSIFFVLCVIALGILMIHLMLQTHFQYLPESIVTVCLGAAIGAILNFTSVQTVFEREEVFSPTAFFLVLLPPIIFEVSFCKMIQIRFTKVSKVSFNESDKYLRNNRGVKRFSTLLIADIRSKILFNNFLL